MKDESSSSPEPSSSDAAVEVEVVAVVGEVFEEGLATEVEGSMYGMGSGRPLIIEA